MLLYVKHFSGRLWMLQAMAAAQDVCAAVLKCVAASRGVRLPPASLQGLIERPPLNPQVLLVKLSVLPMGLAHGSISFQGRQVLDCTRYGFVLSA